MDLLYPAKEDVGMNSDEPHIFFSVFLTPIYWDTLFSFLQLELKPSSAYTK